MSIQELIERIRVAQKAKSDWLAAPEQPSTMRQKLAHLSVQAKIGIVGERGTGDAALAAFIMLADEIERLNEVLEIIVEAIEGSDPQLALHYAKQGLEGKCVDSMVSGLMR